MVAGSNVFSNVPMVLLTGPHLGELGAADTGWVLLAFTTTIAGNLTLVGSVANLIVLELAGSEGKIPFRRFVLVGAGATFLPLFLGLATLLAERRWGLFDAYVK